MASTHPHQLTLAIETSNPSSSEAECSAVAIGSVEDGQLRLRANVPLRPRDRHDDALMPAVAEACRMAGVGPRDIRRLAVSVGPGGFTALRIAATTAKMIALAHGCECFAVPTGAAIARRVPPGCFAEAPVAVALAWKRDTVWVERFTSPRELISAGLEIIENLDFNACSTLICDSRFASMIEARRDAFGGLAVYEPVFDAGAVLEASATLAPIDPLELGPLYPREPEAVTKWRELHGS